MQSALPSRRCSKCHTWLAVDKFSPKRLKCGDMGWQSECKGCRANRERERRTTAEWRASNEVYKTTDVAKARNLRAGRSDAGKATRKRYATSELGRATSKAARTVWLAQPGVRAMLSLQEALRRMMKQSSYESHLLQYMGASRADFTAHVNHERAKDPEMTWERYGYRENGYKGGWDIDHRIPKSKYDHTDVEDIRRCWNLRNLVPMWHVDNLAKGDTVVASECDMVGSDLWPKAWQGVLPRC
jgi:hypothetical protein